jgi:hypothetical protein
LFLRELEFPASLVLWDAILATDNVSLSLVDYVFVALLTCLRERILSSCDNSTCMRLLMQPHFDLDVVYVLKTALYLQNPAIYTSPPPLGFFYTHMDASYEVISQPRGAFVSPGPVSASSNSPYNNVHLSPHSSQAAHMNRASPGKLTSPISMPSIASMTVSTNAVQAISRMNSTSGPPSKDAKKKTNPYSDSYSQHTLPPGVQAMLSMPSSSQHPAMVPMKLFSMEHLTHNVDIVKDTFASKVSANIFKKSFS